MTKDFNVMNFPVVRRLLHVGLDPYIFGGFVRDTLFNVEPRDLDIIVFGDFDTFTNAMRPTRSLGTVIKRGKRYTMVDPSGIEVDVWHYLDHFKECNNISEALKTTAFNSSSVAYCCRSESVLKSKRFHEFENNGTLCIDSGNLMSKNNKKYLAKAFYLMNKLDVKPSFTLNNWIIDAQETTYGIRPLCKAY